MREWEGSSQTGAMFSTGGVGWSQPGAEWAASLRSVCAALVPWRNFSFDHKTSAFSSKRRSSEGMKSVKEVLIVVYA